MQFISRVSTHADQKLTASHVKECMGAYPEHYDNYKSYDFSAPPVYTGLQLSTLEVEVANQPMKIILESIII